MELNIHICLSRLVEVTAHPSKSEERDSVRGSELLRMRISECVACRCDVQVRGVYLHVAGCGWPTVAG